MTNFNSGMTEATIIKFCTRVDCIKFVVSGMTTYPYWAWSGSSDLLKFWEISDNISKMVKDTDIVTMED